MGVTEAASRSAATVVAAANTLGARARELAWAEAYIAGPERAVELALARAAAKVSENEAVPAVAPVRCLDAAVRCLDGFVRCPAETVRCKEKSRWSGAPLRLDTRLLGVAPKLHQGKSGNTTTKECRHARKP